MHIFRWLMSHPIITAWILAALAILLNINMGSKNEHSDTEHVVSHAVESAKTSTENQQKKSAQNQVQDQVQDIETTETTPILDRRDINTVSGSAVIHTHSPELKARLAEEAQRAATNTQANSKDETNIQTPQVATEVVKGSSADAMHSTQSNIQSNIQSSDQSAKNSDAVTKDKDLSAEDLIAMSPDDLLKLAREAFWQNEKDKSAAIYQALVTRVPSSLDYKGELANVLWHQNKQKESAALYAEISMPMLKEGKSREVSNMLGFIGVFFPEKASEIHRAMSERTSINKN